MSLFFGCISFAQLCFLFSLSLYSCFSCGFFFSVFPFCVFNLPFLIFLTVLSLHTESIGKNLKELINYCCWKKNHHGKWTIFLLFIHHIKTKDVLVEKSFMFKGIIYRNKSKWWKFEYFVKILSFIQLFFSRGLVYGDWIRHKIGGGLRLEFILLVFQTGPISHIFRQRNWKQQTEFRAWSNLKLECTGNLEYAEKPEVNVLLKYAV